MYDFLTNTTKASEILFNAGVNETIIDFLLGHSIGKMSQAYKSVDAEKLKKIYVENEKYLTISRHEIQISPEKS